MTPRTPLVTVLTVPLLLALVVSSLPLTGFIDRQREFAEASELDAEAFARNINVVLGWGLVYLSTFIACITHLKQTLRVVTRDLLLATFVVVLLLSVAWDMYPFRATVTALGFLAVVLIAGMASRDLTANPTGPFRVVSTVFGVAQIVNLLLVFTFPESAISEDGRWTGWHGNANALGKESFIAAWASLATLTLGTSRTKRWPAMILLVATVNLLGSNSVTSILAALVLPLFLVFDKLNIRTLGLIAVVPCLGVLLFTLGLLLGFDTLVDYAGRDITWSGRLFAWQLALERVPERPLFGYGFGDTRHYIFDVGVSSTNFHNAYLELAFRVGLVGLGLFTLFLTRVVTTAFTAFRVRREMYWFLSYIVGFLLIGLAESVITATRSQLFVVFWLCVFGIIGARARGSVSRRVFTHPA